MKINITHIEKKLRVKFKNKLLLTQALTHKSANQNANNEKLEFLGDRVLGLTLSTKLFELYPNEKEGGLDKKFARLVNKKTCSSIGWDIGLQNFIILGDSKKKIVNSDEKILSDSCEALLGAVYIDRGYEFAKKFIIRLWSKNIEQSNVTILDSKTKLQEYSLKNFKKLPIYKLVSTKGPKHKPIYKISVTVVGSKTYLGMGNSKQQAQQDCAKNLLENIKNL